MPPKKKVEEEVVGPWMLGRWSRALKVGLVGMPNVGKSTLYNTLSKSHHSKTANVPFCTIDPTETRAFLEDERFDWLVAQHKPKSEVKAFVTVVDIAGLISGAHKGEGLGNAFLSHIQSVDGICHVMRAFENDDVIHAEDTVDPVRDINTICSELRLKDISYMKGKVEFHKKGHAAARTKSPAHLKKWEEELECMEKIIAWLEEGKDVKNGMEHWTTKDIEFLNDYGLLTAKPCMYAVNMNKRDFCRKKNKFLKPIFDWVQANSPGSTIIPYCGAFEEELQDMETDAEREKQLQEDGVTSAMPKMISTDDDGGKESDDDDGEGKWQGKLLELLVPPLYGVWCLLLIIQACRLVFYIFHGCGVSTLPLATSRWRRALLALLMSPIIWAILVFGIWVPLLGEYSDDLELPPMARFTLYLAYWALAAAIFLMPQLNCGTQTPQGPESLETLSLEHSFGSVGRSSDPGDSRDPKVERVGVVKALADSGDLPPWELMTPPFRCEDKENAEDAEEEEMVSVRF